MTKLKHDLRHYRWFRPLPCQTTIPRFFLIRELTRGMSSATECARPAKILSAFCATPSLCQHNPSDFEQCRQFLNSREAIMPLAPAALGGEHFGRRNLHFNGSPKKLEQDPNPFFRGEQASNHDLQSSKRPFNNFNRLANFDGRIDGHDFFCTYCRLKPGHNVFRQGGEVIPKVDDSPDAVRSFNSAMLFRIHKFREQITGKHRFYEPDWPPVGHLAEAQSRRETLDAELTPESDGSQMLPLGLRL
jgi:hypothetical protein